MSVAVTSSETGAIVTWLPPAIASVPSGYNVYGITGDSATLVGHTTAPTTALVAPAGYDTYGVSAVIQGEESNIVKACVDVSFLPPGVAVNSSCPIGPGPGGVLHKVRVMQHVVP
jgi:hypothetical protein